MSLIFRIIALRYGGQEHLQTTQCSIYIPITDISRKIRHHSIGFRCFTNNIIWEKTFH